jgi:hypothetical protein
MTDHDDHGADSYTLAGALVARCLAHFAAQDAEGSLAAFQAMTADPRGFELCFGALSEAYLQLLGQLDDAGALEGGMQVWLDRAAMSFGAAADSVIGRYRGDTPAA